MKSKLFILIIGAIGYVGLPITELPKVDFPTIGVTAILPGASPETMASAVAKVLEINSRTSVAWIP